jgi:hypothetical protein
MDFTGNLTFGWQLITGIRVNKLPSLDGKGDRLNPNPALLDLVKRLSAQPDLG